ncbi:MAG: glycosyltransferase family 4 protein [Planctomycetota bacterium]
MRVLIVNHVFSETDGQGRVNLRVAQHLVGRGHEVTLVGDAVPEAFAADPNVTWLPTRPPPLPTAAARSLVFSQQVERVVTSLRGSYDLLHLNGAQAPGVKADVNACHFAHGPWLRSPHHPRHAIGGARGLYQSLWTRANVRRERRAYHDAGTVVAVSDLVRNQLVNDIGVDPAKIVVLPNASDPPPRVDRAEARRQLLGLTRWSDDDFVILFAGEVKGRRKNLDVNLRALARLPERFRLAVAGSHEGGPYPAEVERSGLGNRVAFLGHRGDLRELYAGADAFVFCSHYDPFALVIVEAMAAGLPTATARTVGAASLVAKAGGLVLDDPADDERLASWLEHLARDLAMREELSRHGREVAAGRTWATAGAAYEEVYLEAAERKKRAQ